MTDKVQGVAKAGEFLGKNLDFFTVTITGDMTATGVYGTENAKGFPVTINGNTYNDQSALTAAAVKQALFEKMLAVIGTRAQPIILGTPTATVLKFAIEHNDAWSAADANSATVNNSLKAALDAAGFTVANGGVVKADTL